MYKLSSIISQKSIQVFLILFMTGSIVAGLVYGVKQMVRPNKPEVNSPAPTGAYITTTIIPSPTVTPTPEKSQGAKKCIVTIFDKQYDVTVFRTGHPGGDVFKCGTDMTAIYRGQHGVDLNRIQPYLVDSTSKSSISISDQPAKKTQYEQEEKEDNE